MFNNMRWRYGDTNPVMVGCDAFTPIYIGDLLYVLPQKAGDALPDVVVAYSQASPVFLDALFATPEPGMAKQCFVGVAMQSNTGGPRDIRVATTGVFEFDCEPSQFCVGDFIGMHIKKDGNSQMVSKAFLEDVAIGLCVKYTESESEKVLVDLLTAKGARDG